MLKNKDKILQQILFELMFSNPQKRQYSEGLTAIELSKNCNIKTAIIKKNLKLLQEKGVARSMGINPKFWFFDEYNFQRIKENDSIHQLLYNVEHVDFECFFDY